MTTWDSYFNIEPFQVEAGPQKFLYDVKYRIVIIGTDKVVGVYNDEKYARKQAKYKFKKMQRKLEKILLG